MTGKIVKGIAGFYYVHTDENRVYECKAAGKFRNTHIKPMVGDDVVIEVQEEGKAFAVISEILPRRSIINRPFAANADQAVIVIAAMNPLPNYNLLDRFLVAMEQQSLHTVICINKIDLISSDKLSQMQEYYSHTKYPVLCLSAKENIGTDALHACLINKTTVFAGASGVGKSTIVNSLQDSVFMETGEISKKVKRGKHTTRHTELIYVEKDTYILDTPGFTSLEIVDCEANDLMHFYTEFERVRKDCRFRSCVHINEPDCAVKLAVSKGEIHELRYQNYKQIYEELSRKKRSYT